MLQNPKGRYPIGEAVWILAGIVILLALGDIAVVLALGAAGVAIAAIWYVHRNIEHPAEHDVTELARVTPLRSGVALAPDVRGPRAA
ncbi:hypothetical protein [Mycobacterium shigaense]|uniref:Uncharacterized protein n=1 Tax=Mycobacterium shigaense TaxID=722731 RepID=A0A1Z4EPR7_9MYCO|nr:hypothetical protein [Mycobacterium shigaense]MEA1121679.1 hypothetical protein [Mycobacterium shigaense]PRI15061.1 hypothetical protein B2J96_11495 [Mycobacterium shigaense]BAX94900.1 hypothetical protein MSG_04790 [Mycobacterium shigaense]